MVGADLLESVLWGAEAQNLFSPSAFRICCQWVNEGGLKTQRDKDSGGSKETMKNIHMTTASRLCLLAVTILIPLLAAAANPDCPAYDRNAWKHQVDEDRDCQNAR